MIPQIDILKGRLLNLSSLLFVDHDTTLFPIVQNTYTLLNNINMSYSNAYNIFMQIDIDNFIKLLNNLNNNNIIKTRDSIIQILQYIKPYINQLSH